MNHDIMLIKSVSQMGQFLQFLFIEHRAFMKFSNAFCSPCRPLGDHVIAADIVQLLGHT